MKKVIFLAIGAFVLLAAYWSLEGFTDAMLTPDKYSDFSQGLLNTFGPLRLFPWSAG